jgi:hypothetical protein
MDAVLPVRVTARPGREPPAWPSVLRPQLQGECEHLRWLVPPAAAASRD